jgi:Fe-S oxidoreductase
VRFRKQEELEKDAAFLRKDEPNVPVKVLTSCPSCLQGLARYTEDVGGLDADYLVVELARHLLGPAWLTEYLERVRAGGVERVLL